MKKIILATFYILIFNSFLFSQTKQKGISYVTNQFNIEAGGSGIWYNLSLGTNLHAYDSTIAGFSVGTAIYPIVNGSGALSFVPSLQAYIVPARFINGKFTFRTGATFYFNQQYGYNVFDQFGNPMYSTFSPSKIYSASNIGILYNVCKKSAKQQLNLGLDVIIGYSEINERHIENLFIPWPVIQYSVKI